jgi:hypothetical protein
MPSITIWNRIEPRCRAADLQQGLAARVHDPLWLLARQWQVGEFESRDAGSPIVANLQASVAKLDRCSIGGQPAQPYDLRQPIETVVEREAVWPARAADDLRQAAAAGLNFARLLNAAHVPAAILSAYLKQYPLDGGSVQPAITGRVIDGVKLRADLIAAKDALPAQPPIPAANHDAVLKATRDWLAWIGSTASEPAAGINAWTQERLEYQFAMGSTGDAGSWVAKEYDGDSIDWYTFEHSNDPLGAATSAQPSTLSKKILVKPVNFKGMPARRFWEMEDGGTNLGALTAAAEDLGRLLLRDFALIYGNDWFEFPFSVPVGSVVQIQSLGVLDTFGVSTAIPHYSAVDATSKWRIFEAFQIQPSAVAAPLPAPHVLWATPGAVASVDGAAIEDVLLLRDELANMVWGIERTVMGAAGEPVDRTLLWRTNAPPLPPPSGGDGTVFYRLGSTVPDYWVPFLPVETGDGGPLQLRRGRLPGPAATTAAQGRFLTGPGVPVIALDEAPREGVHLVRRFRSARGPDGSVHLWVGRFRNGGRGEGRSGLRFDYVE